jgi:hypothetical protein
MHPEVARRQQQAPHFAMTSNSPRCRPQALADLRAYINKSPRPPPSIPSLNNVLAEPQAAKAAVHAAAVAPPVASAAPGRPVPRPRACACSVWTCGRRPPPLPAPSSDHAPASSMPGERTATPLRFCCKARSICCTRVKRIMRRWSFCVAGYSGVPPPDCSHQVGTTTLRGSRANEAKRRAPTGKRPAPSLPLVIWRTLQYSGSTSRVTLLANSPTKKT